MPYKLQYTYLPVASQDDKNMAMATTRAATGRRLAVPFLTWCAMVTKPTSPSILLLGFACLVHYTL